MIVWGCEFLTVCTVRVTLLRHVGWQARGDCEECSWAVGKTGMGLFSAATRSSLWVLSGMPPVSKLLLCVSEYWPAAVCNGWTARYTCCQHIAAHIMCQVRYAVISVLAVVLCCEICASLISEKWHIVFFLKCCIIKQFVCRMWTLCAVLALTPH